MHTAPDLAAAASSLSSVAADAVVILVIVFNMFWGWKRGMTRRVIAFGGTYLGALGAWNVGNAFAGLIHNHDINTSAWSFIGFFLLITGAVEFLAELYGERINKMVVVPFDRISGIFGGAVLGFFEIVIIFSVAIAASGTTSSVPAGSVHGISAEAIHNGALSGLVIKANGAVYDVYAPVLPNNMSAHLKEGVSTCSSAISTANNSSNGQLPPANPSNATSNCNGSANGS